MLYIIYNLIYCIHHVVVLGSFIKVRNNVIHISLIKGKSESYHEKVKVYNFYPENLFYIQKNVMVFLIIYIDLQLHQNGIMEDYGQQNYFLVKPRKTILNVLHIKHHIQFLRVCKKYDVTQNGFKTKQTPNIHAASNFFYQCMEKCN